MTARKLSASDKQTILDLYRLPGETTSTIAERYGVSNSTISRILKNSFSEAEYEALIQQKRSGRSAADGTPVVEDPAAVVEAQSETQLELQSLPVEHPEGANGRRRRRSSAVTDEMTAENPHFTPTTAERLPAVNVSPRLVDPPVLATGDAAYDAEASVIEEILSEEMLEQEDDLEEDDLDDLEDEDEDDDLEDLDGELEGNLLVATRSEGKMLVQVLPLAEASLPRTCYLVVDRAAELIARPLKDFGDLGQIPEAEIQEKTLPVFDNHRIAKRYSNPRTQRVIKLPDGRVLQKTSSHLQAKGITRLLIDGQVYSLN